MSMRWDVAAGVVLAAAGWSGGATAQVQPFPYFQLYAECVKEGGPPKAGPTTGFDFRSCRIQELQARDDLMARWPTIPPDAVSACMGLARGTGYGSYAILRACIDQRTLGR